MMLAHVPQVEINNSPMPADSNNWSGVLTPPDTNECQYIHVLANFYSRFSNEGQFLMLDDTLPDFDMLVRERLVMVEWRGDFIYASAIDADLRDGILEHLMRRGVQREWAEQLIEDFNRFAALVDALHGEHMQSILAIVHGDLLDAALIGALRAINSQFRERFVALGDVLGSARTSRPRTNWSPAAASAASN